MRDQIYELVRCTSCSVVWLSNAPDALTMSAHYGPSYHNTIVRAAESSPERWKEHYRVLSRYKRGGVVLDIGCSSGSFLKALSDGAWKLCGIEISPEAAARSRSRTAAAIFVGDILEAPFDAESVDVVTCFDVLEHLHRPKDALKKIMTWLKPDGIFYICIPNVLSWEARLFRSYWYGLELPRHLYHFSPESIRHLTASVGLREERLVTPPVNHVERSTYYLWGEACRGVGLRRPSMALAVKNPSLAWRVLRKAWRVSALSVFSCAASYAGAGPGIEAIFRKDAGRTPAKADLDSVV